MKILVTGAKGYIGSRLLVLLLEARHEVFAMVRHLTGLPLPTQYPNLKIITGDLLDPQSLEAIPQGLDAAYYLVHAMSYNRSDFPKLEEEATRNFIARMGEVGVKQIIYLSGLCSDRDLSPHLASRYHTECMIKASDLSYTVLRAGIIIGSGSASFEMIRDLTEKLPIMVAPKWVNNLCQPISINDVLRYLISVLGERRAIDRVFDIGGPDRISYKEMMLIYAHVRKLRRYIFVVPVLTPRLSSYWLYFVTSVNYTLASSLVESVKNSALCSDAEILKLFPQPCMGYATSIRQALDYIEQNPLIPSWKDTLVSPELEAKLNELGNVPRFGCLIDRQRCFSHDPLAKVIERVWTIGGDNGWYYLNWAWSVRGFIDKLVGGVGLTRGRAHPSELRVGASLDFWRVLVADKEKGHLVLFAEMKVPGEAWLEFSVLPTKEGCELIQIATFRPRGLWGRFYWYALLPIHKLIFRGMACSIAKKR